MSRVFGSQAERPPIRWTRVLPLVPATTFILVLFVAPVLWLFSLSVVEGGSFTLGHYLKLVQTPVYLQVVWITFKVSALVALVSVVAGYPVAYVLASLPERRRQLWLVLVLLPFWTSFLVRTFAWMLLLGNAGAINKALQGLGLADHPVRLMYNLTGVLVGMVHALMPYAILTMVSVMQGIDRNLVRAAQLLGAPPAAAFWRVYFPLSLPGVGAGALLVFITGLGYFITPAFLGGPKEMMIAQAIQVQVNQLLNWGFAAALSVVLLLATLLVFIVYTKILPVRTLYGNLAGYEVGTRAERSGRQTRSGGFTSGALQRVVDWLLVSLDRLSPARIHGPSRQPGGWVLFGLVGVVLAFLVVPILFVIPVSFTKQGFVDFPPHLFSLQWYRTYLADPIWVGATLRSLQVAALTAALAVLLGTPAAFALVRANLPGSDVLRGVLLSPMIIPRMITAIAAYYLFARLRLVGTTTGLVLGHTVLALPYVVTTLVAVLEGFDLRLEHAAAILGANRWRQLWHVTFPLIRSGLLSAFLFAFVTSFDDLTFALFITGGLVTTLPRKMWDDMFMQINPTLAAVSTILVGFAAVGLLGSELIRQRLVKRQEEMIPVEG